MEKFGPIAGLSAAACWAVASVFYARVPLGAGAMTTFKNSLAASCMLIWLAANSWVQGTPLFQAPRSSWWDVGISGIIGLCLADIAYFRSIQILGPRRGLTLTLLIPPTTAILGQLWLRDTLSWVVWFCILLTLVGIFVVMRERAEPTAEQQIRPGSMQWGIACALMSVATMAVGAVILKRGTQGTDAIEATFIRLLAASLFGVVLSAIVGELKEIAVLMKDRKGMQDLCFASFLGTVIGVYLMVVAYKFCPTGIAATLTSTAPLFVIPIVYFFYRQRISKTAIVGAGMAFLGVCGLLISR